LHQQHGTCDESYADGANQNQFDDFVFHAGKSNRQVVYQR